MLARLFTVFMVVILVGQLRPGHLPAAAAARAQRARLVGVARGGVPGQQLDPAVLGVLRPVRDDVPDAERGGHRRAPHRRRRRSSTSGWLPIGLVLLFLTGVGPLLGVAQVARSSNLRDQFLWPRHRARSSTAGALAALGVRVWASGLCFALCAFVAGTIVQEFWRGANVRRGATGTDSSRRSIGLVGRNKRRYGGYIVHVGIVLIFLGFAGEGFKQERAGAAEAGRADDGRPLHGAQRRVEGDRRRPEADGHGATSSVFEDGKQIDTLYPAKWFFRKHEDEPTTEVAIRRRPARICTSCSAEFDVGDADGDAAGRRQPARQLDLVRLRRPGVRHRHRAAAGARVRFALAKLPAERGDDDGRAAAADARARRGRCSRSSTANPTADVRVVPRATPLERQLQQRDRLHLRRLRQPARRVPDAVLPHAGSREGQPADDLVDQGKTHDEIIAGLHSASTAARRCSARRSTRASTGSRGCSRIWWAPAARSAIGFVAVRWSRRDPAGSDAQTPVDPHDAKLDERLDDELRNLD